LRAFAVAAAGGNGAGPAGCVRAKNEAGEKDERDEKNEPQERAAEAGLKREERDHGRSVKGFRKKTDGAAGLGGSGQWF